jgi:hypothetical protein
MWQWQSALAAAAAVLVLAAEVHAQPPRGGPQVGRPGAPAWAPPPLPPGFDQRSRADRYDHHTLIVLQHAAHALHHLETPKVEVPHVAPPVWAAPETRSFSRAGVGGLEGLGLGAAGVAGVAGAAAAAGAAGRKKD